MRHAYAPILLFAFFFNTADAAYYASDYDPDYLPHNYQEAVNTGYSGCNDILYQYDNVYDRLSDSLREYQLNQPWADKESFTLEIGRSPGMEGQHIQSFSQLQSVTEEEIRQCLGDYRLWLERQKQLEEEQAKRAAEKERETAVQQALSECDFDFFLTMSESEKMASYDERKACELAKSNQTQTTPSPSQTITAVPMIPQVPQSLPPPIRQESITEPITSSVGAADDVATSSEEKESQNIETQPSVSGENPGQQQANANQEPAPSFIKKVLNFLFGWLW
jgi:hypothetical protein